MGRKPRRGAAAARRIPIQARSRQRVESILEAAAHVFAEQGFEAATTEGIAEKAGTSIGSLYQFFPHKLAIFQALALRCLERTRTAFDALFPRGEVVVSWRELLDAMVEGFAVLHQTDPAFRAVIVNFQLYGVFADADADLHRNFVKQIGSVIGRLAPELSKMQRRAVSEMVVTTIAVLLYLSERSEPEVSKALMAETKVMLQRYLEPYLPG